MKAGILGLIIIICSICIAFFIIVKNTPLPKPLSQSKNILPAQVKLYSNSVYQYGFSYPMKFNISENSDKTKITIFDQKTSMFFIQVIASSSAVSRRTPLQTILEICRGNNKAAQCSLDSQSVITSISGVSGNSYYIKKTQLVVKTIVGPFISFPLPANFPFQSGYMIFYPAKLILSDADRENFMTIMNTITLPQIHSIISPTGSSSAK
jgi:hypothetical protein